MTDKPASRGFLNCLFEATANSPEAVQKLVRQAIHSRSTVDLMAFCEIVDKDLLRDVADNLVTAAAIKLQSDAEAHRIGTSSFESLIRHIAMTGLIAGAHLAKEKKL